MQQGHLSTYFEGVAIKRLSAVEANPGVSNQHEFNGVNQLKKILGIERKKFTTRFIYLGEDEDETITESGFLTWYDARKSHPTRSEYRLYYPTTSVSEMAAENDLLVIGKLSNGSIVVIITRADTTFENKILWLFNISDNHQREFAVTEFQPENDTELNFASRLILAELGIEIAETDENYLELILERFGEKFPTTRVFSAFARETLGHVTATQNPDQILMAWMEHEELLFRTLERYIVGKRIAQGFEDVDTFISFSLSVQNRRKSRVGFALENHLEQVFIDNTITYSRGKITENKAKPDFIFPSINAYQNLLFSVELLTMLGVKSTCKDRWRQVLSEAARIQKKHLLTLEPGISENQTQEMQSQNLQLVVPQTIHATYKSSQQPWLMTVESLVKLVKERQRLN